MCTYLCAKYILINVPMYAIISIVRETERGVKMEVNASDIILELVQRIEELIRENELLRHQKEELLKTLQNMSK